MIELYIEIEKDVCILIVLSCNNLSKAYLVDNILEDISFSINQNEKVGLVGLNGAGKSTLFNILTGEISADSGTIHMPKDYGVGILRQQTSVKSENTIYEELLSVFSDLIAMEESLRAMEREISEEGSRGDSNALEKLMASYADKSEQFQSLNGYGFKSEVKGVLKGLGFSDDFLHKPISELSGGQKARVALGKILLQKPEILLLDEPTNHLDIDAISWLEKYIKDYDGTVILISHDRYFLDNTVSKIFHLERGKLNVYRGNYTEFMKKRKKDMELLKKQYDMQQKEISELKEFVEKNKARASTRNMAMSRQKKLDKISVMDAPSGENARSKIRFEPSVQSGDDVLHAENLSLSFDGIEIFRDASLRLYKGDHAGLIGPNGVGKTSLFKSIQGIIEVSGGTVSVGHNVHIGYFDQEQSNLDDENTVIDEIWNEYPKLTHSEIRTLLARFLFIGDDIFKEVSLLSGGERSRLSLLKLMLSKSNFLLMDEPTNHLDLDSKEVLEDAIMNYDGTVLVISHDRYFLNKISNKILEMKKTGIGEYLGDYDYYLEKKSIESQPEVEPSETANKTQAKAQKKKDRETEKLEKKEKKKLKDLEAQIAALEEHISILESKLCEPEVYSDHELSLGINKELQEQKSLLEQQYEDWILITES